jgi:hypothetical protein
VDATNTTGPDAAVGQISVPHLIGDGSSSCSATAIQPHVVVTARHCFCKNPDVLPGQVTFTLPGGPDISAERIFAHAGSLDVCTKSQTSLYTAGDVAALVLAEPIPPSVLSTFMKVHFKPDAHHFVGKANDGYRFFQTGYGRTSWGEKYKTGTRRTGPVVDFWQQVTLDPFVGLFYTAIANQSNKGANSTLAKGDSGGPLWMARLVDGVLVEPSLVGVISEFDTNLERQYWAPTWLLPFSDGESAGMNGQLILDALAAVSPDLDGDGFIDTFDNCPPSLCPDDPSKCANPEQSDWDGDGYGDACDPCREDIDKYTKNKPPPDWDHDGTPDACDRCPTLAYGNVDDSGDDDKVGAACDNCPGASNPVRACTSDADCPKTASGLHNFCILPKGKCAAQVDDEDGDGLGDACDRCPKNAQNGLYQLHQNSNVAAEERWSAPALDDVCDPVATYVSRPESQSAFKLCPTLSDLDAKCTDTLPFTATPRLGTEKYTKANPTPTSFKAPVGFRHCDCHDDNGNELTYNACITGRCTVEDEYSVPSSPYVRVTMTTKTSPGKSIYPSSNMPAYFASRTFTNDANSGLLGVPESNRWRWKADVEAGHVLGYPDPHTGELTTRGIFWSYALPTTKTTSPRDAGYAQRLRSHHGYVRTPFMAAAPLPDKVPGWPNLKDCQLLPCWLLIRPDQAIVNPNPFDRSIFEQFDGPSLIVATPSLPILIDQAADRYDATSLLSEALTARLLEGGTQWLRPVETGHMLRDFERGTAFVGLPNEWTQGSTLSPIVMSGDQLIEAERAPTHGLAALGRLESEPEPAEPSPRSGARGVYSARTGAVYLVGGTAGEGPTTHSTGEIWRYDLAAGTWEDLPMAVPRVQNVLALAYDSAKGQLLVLDAPKRTSWLPAPLRLLLVNTQTHTSKLLGQFPRTLLFDRYSLTARGDGSYLLVASRRLGAGVLLARLAVTEDERLRWTGLSARNGELFDEPALTDDGVVVPLLRKGKLELATIADRDLGPCLGIPGVF